MIRFRAWDKQKERMFNVKSLHFNKDGTVNASTRLLDSIGASFVSERVELMLSTGLKDKNGIEIFEGDILLCDISYGGKRYKTKNPADQRFEWKWKEPQKGIVVWNLKGACWGIKTLGTEGWLFYPEKYQEIIGNIYENPELIKGDE